MPDPESSTVHDAGGAAPLFNRRRLLTASAYLSGGAVLWSLAPASLLAAAPSATVVGAPLQTFSYDVVSFAPGQPEQQMRATIAVLLGLSDDALLKPFRVRAGMAAPGDLLGGWYDSDGYAPGHTFGQWLSAFARYSAATGDERVHAKVTSMVKGLAEVPDPEGHFFEDNRFPAYTLEKLNIGMIDAYSFAKNEQAVELLASLTQRALPHLPERALSRAEQQARPYKDISYTFDEAYTLPENYFLAYQRTGDMRYRELGLRFLHRDGFLDPLTDGENVLPGLHAFSHLNALNSAMQAYLILNETKYLQAARNGFQFIQEQSYATGGWGPDERFVTPGRGELAKSLTATHSSFETPCGAYGHFKLTRTLLQATRESTYGDSMEAVFYNTVQGAKALEQDGSAFYYSDYNPDGSKGFARDKWPCCSGTLPQVAADYRISAYLHDASGVYVNLYLPSSVSWRTQGGLVKISQQGAYPLGEMVHLRVDTAGRHPFALHLRIPKWTGNDAKISINGSRYAGAVRGGSFATVTRVWRAGDRIELTLPMSLRLQAVDAETPETVALLRGPLVLFPVGPGLRTFRETDLLQAQQASPGEWVVRSTSGDVRFRPFASIGDEGYSTYVGLV